MRVTQERIERSFLPVISMVTGELRELGESRRIAGEYLSETLFAYQTDIHPVMRENMVKQAAKSRMLQHMNCLLLGKEDSQETSEQAMLVGAMINPYDGLLDEASIGQALSFCNGFMNVFDLGWTKAVYHDAGSRQNEDNEATFYNFFNILRMKIPYDRYPGFWKTLKALHLVQTISLLQRVDVQKETKFGPSEEDLETISKIKGGLSAMLYVSLLNDRFAESIPEVSIPAISLEGLPSLWAEYIHDKSDLFIREEDSWEGAAFKAGAFTQAIDDFEDCETDRQKGIRTSMNSSFHNQAEFLYRAWKEIISIRNSLLKAGGNPIYVDQWVRFFPLYLGRKVYKRFTGIISPRRRRDRVGR